MIDVAQKDAKKTGITNLAFILTNTNRLPLPDNSVDGIMSNCVLDLVSEEDKLVVMQEIHRILKPCGRIAVSDFLALKPFNTRDQEQPSFAHCMCLSVMDHGVPGVQSNNQSFCHRRK